MKSSYITNSVLIVVIGLAIWFLQDRSKNEPEENQRFSHLTADQVSSISIQQPGKPIISLQKEQLTWHIISPFPALANQTRINILLRLLNASVHGEFQPMSSSSLSQFGLTKPQAILTLNDETIVFGNVETISQNRYILYKEMIYLINDDTTPLLRVSADNFVDNHLIPESSEITKLVLPTLDDKQAEVTIIQEDGEWHSSDVNLTTDLLKQLADNWQYAQASQVSHITDEEKIEMLHGLPVSIHFAENAQVLHFVLNLDEHQLTLFNTNMNLLYRFPLALKTQLLPSSIQVP
ncbi:MAG TPA: DUF4340 domain-containing protein [Methylophaga aminisulfidivorans]|uniref:DUF4340 domain-containing protein n=2 Tax=root TaxID=1 RepID=A0A7C1ZNC6_9GAMM|nr:DUF4340 domain-containing protein [Methylophaga aminisulfidivorans]